MRTLVLGACLLLAAPRLHAQASVDFGRDKKADVIVRNSITGEPALLCMDGLNSPRLRQLVKNGIERIPYDAAWQPIGPISEAASSPCILWRNIVTGDIAQGKVPPDYDIIDDQMIYKGVSLDWQLIGAGPPIGNYTRILWRNQVSGDAALWKLAGTWLVNPNTSIIAQGVSLDWQMVANIKPFYNWGSAFSVIYWRNARTGDVSVWTMNDLSTRSAVVVWPGVPLDWQIVGSGDFNGDQTTDLLWRNTRTGAVSVWMLLNDWNIFAFVIHPGVSLEWQIVGTGDFNGDGKADILWLNSSTREMVVSLMDSLYWMDARMANSAVVGTLPIDWEIVHPSRKVFGMTLNVPSGSYGDPLMTTIAPRTDWVRIVGTVDNSTLLLSDAPLAAHQHGLKTAVVAQLNGDITNNSQQVSGLIALIQKGWVDLAVVGSGSLSRGDLTEAQVLETLHQVRQEAPPGTKITYADRWDQIVAHPNIIAACDIVGVSIYPFYENASIEMAGDRLQADYQATVDAAGGKPVWIMETGWPSEGAAPPSSPLAQPSMENSARYFYDTEQWARSVRVPLFYCQAYDDPAGVTHDGYASWGIWDVFGAWKSGMSAPFQ